MPNWTLEQLDAINLDNSNIIVSAGAGSGKTAVLSERVIRKLKDGVDIDSLLILTFTKAAAGEMKERIRKKITNDSSLEGQLSKIDSAYITTFDAYALALVKKYHYLLNLSSNIKIAESSIISIQKEHILDGIMDSYYAKNDKCFLNLINDFCIKDDLEIRRAILNINSKMDMIYDKEKYISDYILKFYSDEYIDSKINDFQKLLCNKVLEIEDSLSNLKSYVDSTYYDKIKESLSNLIKSFDYESIKSNINIKLPNLPKDSEIGSKEIKDNIASIIKELKELLIYADVKEIKKGILATKKYTTVILDIIDKLDKEIKEYKFKNDIFEFNDIASMAIKLLADNEDVRLDLKNKFNEIMIDEYQDTNDLQDLFISYIENNNVYMVGDIKQSIYRFRNANPKLFGDKYRNYSNNQGGVKIDLNKNFRSREEVLEDINSIFNNIMFINRGNADYKNSHQMVFGNDLYTTSGRNENNNHLELLNYNYDNSSSFTKTEMEIFIIAKDIKEKIDSKYQVFDIELGYNRTINYSDIAILMDRTTNFDLYKKIFEYFNIPLTLYKDEKITDNINLNIIKNILILIMKVKSQEFDKSFEYCFMSILRSYLFNTSDEEIFNMIRTKNYNYILLDKINYLSLNIESNSLDQIIRLIIKEFNIYDRLVLIGDINNNMVCLEYLVNLTSTLAAQGYTLSDFIDYLDDIIANKYDIRFLVDKNNNDSVKIMTIHKSKGLEFKVCYYSGLYSKFNISDIKDYFIFDNEFGIITPYIDSGIHFTIYKDLLKYRFIEEEISEKIRLFYVALTRSKEKMIMVASVDFDKPKKNKYMSFLDIVGDIKDIIPNIIDINVDDLHLTKNYNDITKVNIKEKVNIDNSSLVVSEYKQDTVYEENRHFSKNNTKLLSKEEVNNIKYGKQIHLLFENTNFLNPDYQNMSDNERKLIDKFISTGILDGAINVYKEYEFMDINNDIKYHGIIDLLLEYEDEFKIVDYKLKNIKDDEYLKQLNGYKNYIEKVSDKKVSIYLYSIITGVLEQI